MTEEQKDGEIAVEEMSQEEKEQLAMEQEGEIDFSDPEKTPVKYNYFKAEQIKKVNQIATDFVNDVLAKSDLPFAFAEEIPRYIAGRLSIIKGKSKLWEKKNKLDNLFHLTQIKDLELYETIEESNQEIEDLDSEGIV